MVYSVTLGVTPYWNSDPYFPSSHFCFQRPLLHIHFFSMPNSNLNPSICIRSSICSTLTILPISYPFPVYPDQRFHNSVSDSLIPLAVLTTLHVLEPLRRLWCKVTLQSRLVLELQTIDSQACIGKNRGSRLSKSEGSGHLLIQAFCQKKGMH